MSDRARWIASPRRFFPAIGEALGVDESTVRRDVSANAELTPENDKKINGGGSANAEVAPVDALAVIAADEAVCKQIEAEADKAIHSGSSLRCRRRAAL